MKIVIVGCNRISASLSNVLLKDKHNITIIDKSENTFSKLEESYTGDKILGDATDIDILKKADLDTVDMFLALTDNDNANIMIAQIVKNKFKTKRIICKVDDPIRAQAYKELDLETICPTTNTINMLKNIISSVKKIVK
ncbi:MAG: TrkA family potassium uptake protein [Candidatus Firestonebacteria bacterium]